MKLLENNTFKKRVDKLKSMLNNCVLCPHQCSVDRIKGEAGFCKTLTHPVVSGAEAHYGEEKELVGRHGSGTIFFSHCNLKCVFCQNYEISHCGEGNEISVEQLAEVMLYLQKRKCHNINLVSPGHIIPQIVEAIYLAANEGLTLPIVYNTNGYDLTDTLMLLEDIIDIYMPDLKFSDDTLAEKYLGVKQYYSIATAAIKEMFHQVGNLKTDGNNIAYRGLMIRHLVMPENIASTDKIMGFIANHISKDTYINVMSQYYPAYRSHDYKELSQNITRQDFQQALKSAKEAGLTNSRGF